MVSCDKCGKKIGLLRARYPFQFADQPDKSVYYCTDCNDAYLAQVQVSIARKKRLEAARRKREEDKRYDAAKVEETRRKQEEEKNRTAIEQVLKPYLAKNAEITTAVAGYLGPNGVWGKDIDPNSLSATKNIVSRVRERKKEMLHKGMRTFMGEPDGADLLEMIELDTVVLKTLDDLEMIKRLLEKQGVETDYREICAIINDVVQKKAFADLNKILKPIEIRIKNRYGQKQPSVETVIREFVQVYGPICNEIALSRILEHLGTPYDPTQLNSQIARIKEEDELKEFEKNLTSEQRGGVISTNYETLDGYQFEEFLCTIFEHLGYITVRTKLSGDQGADLIMKKDGETIVVQAKRYEGPVPNSAVQAIVAAKVHYHADRAMVVTTGEFTRSAIELSLSNRVELWDGKKLASVINEINQNIRPKKEWCGHVAISEDFSTQKLDLACPVCETKFQLPCLDGPRRGETVSMQCGACGMTMSISVPSEFYECTECKAEFVTIAEHWQHKKDAHGTH